MPKALKTGDLAPNFKLKNQNGEWISLNQFKGQHLVLYFYPKDMTPGCTIEACDFRDRHPTFKKLKIPVLGVSKDPADRHQKFREKYSLRFDLLCDEDAKVCEAYGAYGMKSLYGRKFKGIIRTTVVIGPSGRIEHLYPKVKVKGHVEQILKDLKT